MKAKRIWRAIESDEGGWPTAALVILLISAIALLSACSTTAPERIRIVEKVVPVSEKPIAAADIPKVPAPLPPRPKSLKAASDLLLAKHCEWVTYADDANRLLAHSAGLPPPPPLSFEECKER